MWSFILIDTNNSPNLQKAIDYIKLNYDEPDIICCHTNEEEYKDVRNYIFKKDENKEAILNTVAKKCENEHIVIVRNVEDYESIKQMTSKVTQDSTIVCKKTNKKGIKNWLKDKLVKVVNFVFNQNIQLIDFGVIAYGRTASITIKNATNPSTLTRTNNFLAVNFVYLDGENKYLFKYDKAKTILSFVIPIIMLVVTILCLVLIKNINIVLIIGLIGLAILEFVFCLLFGLVWFIKTQIGDNNTNTAKYK